MATRKDKENRFVAVFGIRVFKFVIPNHKSKELKILT